VSISASSVWEVRTAGNDTNGGGFVSGASGTDYSQQDSKNSGGNNGSTTDAVGLGTDHITSVSASFTSAMIGNLIYLQGGTGGLAAGWYEVIGFTSSTNIQLDRTVAIGTGITMNIGGALLTWGQANANVVTSNQVWIKAGTYVLTTGTATVAGGVVDLTATGGAAGAEMKWEGYQTTRGDLGTKPVLQVPGAGVTNITMFNAGGQFSTLRNVTFDGNSKTAIMAYHSQNFYNQAIDCRAINVTSNGFQINDTNCNLIRCYVTNCSATYPNAAFHIGDKCAAFGCVAQDCASTGFYMGVGTVAAFCIADTCALGGFANISTGLRLWNCTAYGNTGTGFDFTTAGGNGRFLSLVINCLAEGNSGEGFGTDAASPGVWMFNCGGYNNTSGNYNATNLPHVSDFAAATASFFTDAAGGDFTINNTAGGGALARGTGIPGTMPS
jgi:hypothetical protein